MKLIYVGLGPLFRNGRALVTDSREHAKQLAERYTKPPTPRGWHIEIYEADTYYRATWTAQPEKCFT